MLAGTAIATHFARNVQQTVTWRTFARKEIKMLKRYAVNGSDTKASSNEQKRKDTLRETKHANVYNPAHHGAWIFFVSVSTEHEHERKKVGSR